VALSTPMHQTDITDLQCKLHIRTLYLPNISIHEELTAVDSCNSRPVTNTICCMLWQTSKCLSLCSADHIGRKRWL
jgi:hypothetical protein